MAIAPAIARPSVADFPLPLAAVMATVDLSVFSAIASMNFTMTFAWQTNNLFRQFTSNKKLHLKLQSIYYY